MRRRIDAGPVELGQQNEARRGDNGARDHHTGVAPNRMNALARSGADNPVAT